MLFLLISFASCRKLPADQSIKSDTTYTESLRLLPSKGFSLPIGDSLVTPEVTFIRISESQVAQKFRTKQVTTQLVTSHAVPTKIKSKIKMGKQVDKRDTKFNSDNKSKPTSKVKSGGFPWWIWLIVLALAAIIWGQISRFLP